MDVRLQPRTLYFITVRSEGNREADYVFTDVVRDLLQSICLPVFRMCIDVHEITPGGVRLPSKLQQTCTYSDDPNHVRPVFRPEALKSLRKAADCGYQSDRGMPRIEAFI